MKFHDTFPDRKALLTVIHVRDLDQALLNACAALGGGADGVFLISHDTDRVNAAELIGIYHGVRSQLPEAWIGLNCLDLRPDEMFENAPEGLGGIWVDNCGVPGSASLLSLYRAAQQRSHFGGLYFASVAFKYQAPVSDQYLPAAASLVADFADVVTTSGDGTGKAASLEKIRIIRKAIGDSPLAVASGITSSNVSDFLHLGVDCFIVASGISRDFHNLEPGLVRELASKIHA